MRLGDDAELGKPSRMEHYFVHPVEGELSFDEAEAKANGTMCASRADEGRKNVVEGVDAIQKGHFGRGVHGRTAI